MTSSFAQRQSFSVIVADDQSEWRQRIRKELERQFPHQARPIIECSRPDEAIQQCKERKPDLVFTDIQYEDEHCQDHNVEQLNGIFVARKIWEELPNTAIIIVSSYTSQEYVHDLYEVMPEAASYGWLVKSRLVRDLPAATRTVLDGDCWVDSDVERIEGRLSKQEQLENKLRETLIFVALGYSQRAIAALLKVSPKAVEKRLDEMYVRLGLPLKHAKKDDPAGAGIVNHRCRAVWMGFECNYITEAELKSRRLTLPDDDELKDLMIRHEVSTRPEIRSVAKALFELLTEMQKQGRAVKQSAAGTRKDEFLDALQEGIARCIIEKELEAKDYYMEIPVRAELLSKSEILKPLFESCQRDITLAISPGSARILSEK